MPVKISGLPAHALLVHVLIVLLPLAALLLVLSVVWPAARARLGLVSPGVAAIALICVPVTVNAGNWLRNHLRANEGHLNPLIRRHANLGNGLLVWAIAVFVLAAGVWLLTRRYELVWRPRGGTERAELPAWVTAGLAVVTVAVAVGAIVQLYRVGDSGAKAVWSGRTIG